MLALLLGIGPLLAGSAAVVALISSATKSARLRRQEKLFREAKTATEVSTRQYAILDELHRATVANLVARQLTGAWRVTWPWLAGFVTVALSGQLGYYAAEYLSAQPDVYYQQFVVEVFGDSVTPFLAAGLVLGVLPTVFMAYVDCLIERARIARRYYAGKQVSVPKSLTAKSIEANLAPRPKPIVVVPKVRRSFGSRVRSFGTWLWSIAVAEAPGLLAVSLGVMAGMAYGIREYEGEARLALLDESSIGRALGAIVLLLMVSLTITLHAVADLMAEIRAHWPPTSYPGSALVKGQPTRRIRGSRDAHLDLK